MRSLPILSASLLFAASALSAQTIAPANAGDVSITVTTAPAAAGDTISVRSSVPPAPCGAAATAVAILPNSNTQVLAGPQTAITLTAPLAAKENICVVTTAGGGATHTSPAVVVGAAPTPPVVPLVSDADGIALSADNQVSNSISVDPLLVPASVAKRVFGKEVSTHYAVVQLTISNHNQNAALILHSILLDYHHWLFSNNFQGPFSLNDNISLSTFQQDSNPFQIASAEARTVRGELQDAQVWTRRNTFIRALSLVATVASGYQFLTTSTNYLQGIGAFGNQFVPAVAAFWPDNTQAQIDRLSDYGFQTNHVIAKASSDIVYAFFPIDTFITPTLRKDFINSPAVFFVPGEMLLDPKYSHTLANILRSTGLAESTASDTATIKLVSDALAHYEIARSPAAASASDAHATIPVSSPLTDGDKVILSVLQRASLNNMRIVVGGVMTVDANAIPAILNTVTVADGSVAATWASGSTVTATINGNFLSDGTLAITPTTGIGQPAIVSKNSTDTTLTFTFPLTAAIASGTTLNFTVTKTATDKSTVVSKPASYTVTYP